MTGDGGQERQGPAAGVLRKGSPERTQSEGEVGVEGLRIIELIRWVKEESYYLVLDCNGPLQGFNFLLRE